MEEDMRVCYKGKVVLKSLAVGDAAEAITVSRSSKLVIGHKLRSLPVMAEIKYLKDGIADEKHLAEMPVTVKELAVVGPGLAKRYYRIDVYSNNGLLLGFAEVSDDKELRKIVGHKGIHLLDCDEDQRDMGEVWRYIVSERLDLDLDDGKPKKKKGLFGGLFAGGDNGEGTSKGLLGGIATGLGNMFSGFGSSKKDGEGGGGGGTMSGLFGGLGFGSKKTEDASPKAEQPSPKSGGMFGRSVYQLNNRPSIEFIYHSIYQILSTKLDTYLRYVSNLYESKLKPD